MNEGYTYTIKKSQRRSAAISITPTGEIVVKVPLSYTKTHIQALIEKYQSWIDNKIKTIDFSKKMDEAVQRIHINDATIHLPSKTHTLSEFMGVRFARVKISNARTRWGSCSSKGTISLNWRLICLPEELRDYVIIHELAHLKHPNHSRNFWDFVGRFVSDYKIMRKKLRDFHHLFL